MYNSAEDPNYFYGASGYSNDWNFTQLLTEVPQSYDQHMKGFVPFSNRQDFSLQSEKHDVGPTTYAIPLNLAAELRDPIPQAAYTTQKLNLFDDAVSQEFAPAWAAGNDFDILLAEMFGSETAPLPLDENLNRLPPQDDDVPLPLSNRGLDAFGKQLMSTGSDGVATGSPNAPTQQSLHLMPPSQTAAAPHELQGPPEGVSMVVYGPCPAIQGQEHAATERTPLHGAQAVAQKPAVGYNKSSSRVSKSTKSKKEG